MNRRLSSSGLVFVVAFWVACALQVITGCGPISQAVSPRTKGSNVNKFVFVVHNNSGQRTAHRVTVAKKSIIAYAPPHGDATFFFLGNVPENVIWENLHYSQMYRRGNDYAADATRFEVWFP